MLKIALGTAAEKNAWGSAAFSANLVGCAPQTHEISLRRMTLQGETRRVDVVPEATTQPCFIIPRDDIR